MSGVVDIVIRATQAVPVVLTNEPTTPKALPESNDSVKAVRALEEQIRALKDTP